MKRLFRIRSLTTGAIVPGDYENKMDAKAARNTLQGVQDADHPWRFSITPGPDHWKYEGDHETAHRTAVR